MRRHAGVQLTILERGECIAEEPRAVKNKILVLEEKIFGSLGREAQRPANWYQMVSVIRTAEDETLLSLVTMSAADRNRSTRSEVLSMQKGSRRPL